MTDPAAEPVPAETRDWTAVTRRPCPECGFDPAAVTEQSVPARILATIPRWQDVLQRPAPRLTARPSPQVWSALEYACHARDVCRTFTDRCALILDGAGAGVLFADWDQNAAQVAGRYNAQEPARVADEYADAARRLAARFPAAQDPRWRWTGERGDGARFTLTSLAAYLVHDLEHHLGDVQAADGPVPDAAG